LVAFPTGERTQPSRSRPTFGFDRDNLGAKFREHPTCDVAAFVAKI
jgi:hypothetical protein